MAFLISKTFSLFHISEQVHNNFILPEQPWISERRRLCIFGRTDNVHVCVSTFTAGYSPKYIFCLLLFYLHERLYSKPEFTFKLRTKGIARKQTLSCQIALCCSKTNSSSLICHFQLATSLPVSSFLNF